MRAFALSAALLSTLAAPAVAQTFTLAHTGYVLNGADAPLSGAQSMSFDLYAGAADATPVWSSGACTVTVSGGYYALALGADCGSPITTTQWPVGATRYLGVSVGSIALTPRLTVDVASQAKVSADAQALQARLKATNGTLNDTNNPVDWSQLKGVPGGFFDGTDNDTQYTAASGGGLALASGAFSLTTTGVTAATYTNANLTVDAQGRITAASNGTAFTGVQLASASGLTGDGTSGAKLSLAPTGVTAAAYTNANVTVDAQGRVTAASNGAVSATNITTGTLAVANGGTGATSLPANRLLLGNGASAVVAVASGSSGQVLTSTGAGAPTWQDALPAVTAGTSTGGGVPANGSASLASVTLPTGKYLVQATGTLWGISANGCADANVQLQAPTGATVLVDGIASQSIDNIGGRHRAFTTEVLVQVTAASATVSLVVWFSLCGGVTASIGSSSVGMTALAVK